MSGVPFDDFISGIKKNVPTPIVELTSNNNNAFVRNSVTPMTTKTVVSVTAPTHITDQQAAVSSPASLTTMTNPSKVSSPMTAMTSNRAMASSSTTTTNPSNQGYSFIFYNNVDYKSIELGYGFIFYDNDNYKYIESGYCIILYDGYHDND